MCAWSRSPAASSSPRRARSRSLSAGAEADMAGPMKMRATVTGGYTEVRVLMTHPMTTAQMKDQPLHFIQNVTVKQNGKTVIEAETSQAVSRNPVFSFRLKGGAKGDKIEVSWLDNKGESNTIETAVARTGLLRASCSPLRSARRRRRRTSRRKSSATGR